MTTIQYETVPAPQARKRGYVPITVGYSEGEHWMLERAIADIATTDHLLVEEGDGIAIWRRKEAVK